MLVFILILRILLGPISNVYQKKISNRGANSLFVVFVTYLGIGLVLLPVSFFIDYSALSIEFWQNIILASLLDGIGNILLVKSLQTTELSVFGPINSLKPAITMILAFLFINEVPTVTGVIGLIIILIGTVIITYKKESNFKVSKGIIYRVSGLTFASIATVYMKKSIVLSSPEITLIFWALIILPIMFIVLLSNLDKTKSNIEILKNSKKEYLILITMYLMMPYATLICFKYTLIGYSLAIFQLSSIINVFFGYKYFNEGGLQKKIFCSILMIIGAGLILLK